MATTMPTAPQRERRDGDQGAADEVADRVDDAVEEHPWLERVMQAGWIAKGAVYTLMGLTAVQIARQDPVAEDASPQGSLDRVVEAPFGRVLIAVLTVGLVLYIAWRVLSIAVIRGTDLSAWAYRAGYAFSALFYLTLAWTGARLTVEGSDPGNSRAVERISRSLLEVSGGRWLLGAVGVGTIVVGAYFTVKKGVMRSFTEDLRGVDSDGSSGPSSAAIVVAGVAGWIGRGVVTALVGFFILRAALRFDPNDARGFDRSLRHIAGTSTGSLLVLAAAVGLIAYGVFCLASHRYRTLEDSS